MVVVFGIVENWNTLLIYAVIFCAIIVIVPSHKVYFVTLPGWRYRQLMDGDSERLRRYLERVVATPCLLGERYKLAARQYLAAVYLQDDQLALAATQFRAIIKAAANTRGQRDAYTLLAYAHRKLAECLETLGQADDAAVERRRAEDLLTGMTLDADGHETRGELLNRRNQHDAAYAEFLKELELIPVENTIARIDCMFRLGMTSYECGRLSDFLSWSQRVLDLGPGPLLQAAHRTAGQAYSNRGQIEESEHHYREAYEATPAEDVEERAEFLALLADCERQRGRLAEANEECAQAAALLSKPNRTIVLVQARILWADGRYDEALALMTREIRCDPASFSYVEQRMRAVIALETARIEAECGRAEEAWTHVQAATAVLSGDPRLGLWCECTASSVLAARGLAEESKRVAERVEARLSAFHDDPQTLRLANFDLGMACWSRGDYRAGIDSWTRYLALRPGPLYVPIAHYHRGECQRQLGFLDAARREFDAAVRLGLDTHFSRLARRQRGLLPSG